jgi:hypothetical protein
MWKVFTKLEWLKFTRSVSLERSLLEKGLVFLVLLFLSLLLFSLASFPDLWTSFLPDNQTSTEMVSSLLWYVLFTEFYLRYIFQKKPSVALNFLKIHPVPRNSLLDFYLLRSFINPFTFLNALFFITFGLQQVYSDYGGFSAFSWVLICLFCSAMLHVLVIWLQTGKKDHNLFIATFTAIVAVLVILNYYQVLNMDELSLNLFTIPLSFNWVFLPCILLVFLSIKIYKQYLSENLNDEKDVRFDKYEWLESKGGFFERFGLSGRISNVELRLITRSKKARSYLVMSLLTFLYGFHFYYNQTAEVEAGFSPFYIFIACFVTGVFMLNYGQMLLSWNTSHFDFYMNKPFGLSSLVEGKYILFAMATVVVTILSLVYIYFGCKVFFVHMAVASFNIGINSFIIKYIALWDPMPMDIEKGGVFNTEGVGCAQFIMGIPVFISPYLFYLPIWLISGSPMLGLFFIFIFGLIGIVFRDKLLALVVNKLLKNRFQISE